MSPIMGYVLCVTISQNANIFLLIFSLSPIIYLMVKTLILQIFKRGG